MASDPDCSSLARLSLNCSEAVDFELSDALPLVQLHINSPAIARAVIADSVFLMANLLAIPCIALVTDGVFGFAGSTAVGTCDTLVLFGIVYCSHAITTFALHSGSPFVWLFADEETIPFENCCGCTTAGYLRWDNC